MNRRSFLGIGAVTCAGALTGCTGRTLRSGSEATALVGWTFPAADVDRLAVRSGVGSVLVVAEESATEVDVRVRKRSPDGRGGLADILVDTDLTDSRLLVTATLRDSASWRPRGTPNTEVTVTVPAGSAGPAVERIDAAVGEVTLLNTRGDTVVEAEVGEIVANGVDGYLTLESELGEILVSDTRGLDRVHTELGEVKADLLSVRGDVDISTELGAVRLGVAETLDVDLDASASGGVDSDLPLTLVESDRSRLAGRLNDGGHQLRVSSELGDVTLRSIPGAA